MKYAQSKFCYIEYVHHLSFVLLLVLCYYVCFSLPWPIFLVDMNHKLRPQQHAPKSGWRIKLAICWLKSFFCCCCLQMALSTIKWSLFHPNKYICLFHKKISNLANCVVRHMSTAEARHAIEWCVCESYVVVSLWNFCTSCFSMLQWWLCLGTLRDNEVKSDVEIP